MSKLFLKFTGNKGIVFPISIVRHWVIDFIEQVESWLDSK